jgi:squamous cell carcinoma antigen recognized by T-cells 3
LLSAKAISDVSLAAARPTYRQLVDEGDSTVFVELIEHLDDGIKRVRDAGGDSRIKLEKLLVHVVRQCIRHPAFHLLTWPSVSVVESHG